MTRLWLIRHGEPAAEARRHCYGSLDVRLSEYGRAQMAEVARYLQAEPLAVIYASTRSRALESAQILAAAHSCPVEVVPDLREIDFGDFEGLAYDEIAARYPDLYRQWMETPTEIRFPNGEAFGEMRARVLRAAEAIRLERAGQTAAIVSHGGVNRILIAHALQMPDECLFRLAQNYAAINLLSFVDGVPSVQLMNHHVGA
ncbi:MAG TPA: alpha-ribazole phosphatase [Bryobacteraceae bacterium]|nr:alpha-ribazole phosphatase [Bryobacteraceae bacterium]